MSCLKKLQALEDLLCRYLLQAWEYDTSKYPGPPHRSVGVGGVLGFRRGSKLKIYIDEQHQAQESKHVVLGNLSKTF